MESKIREALSKCKTDKQVITLLKKYNLKIKKNKTAESEYFNIWLDDETRIYKSGKQYILQTWSKTKVVGVEKRTIPICYGHTTIIESPIEIKMPYGGVLSKC